MKKIILLASVLVLGINSQAQSQEEAMQKWMEYSTPSTMHKMLEQYNGVFNATTTMWMMPGAEPTVSSGTVTNDMAHGDRYQKSMYSASMQGMPFSGESTTAYDNMKKIFINTWIDNMGTGMIYSEGKWNADKKTVTYLGNMSEPMSGQDLKVRQVVTYIDSDNYKMEMYYDVNGSEFKSMEAVYTRQ